MPDFLGGDGTRDYFRISEMAECDLKIAFSIIGQAEKRTGVSQMAMWMGTALEPVINRFLLSNGLSIAFGKVEESNAQLEVALEDPYVTGHPDGLVFLGGDELSIWAQRNLPQTALTRLAAGEVLLHEVKTMKNDTWRQWVKSGIASMTFTAKYLMQVNAYMLALNNEQSYELWPDRENGHTIYGSQSFKSALEEIGGKPPTAALITGFNTHTKKTAFELIEFDPELPRGRLAELQIVADYLHNGELPAPTYDGKAPDCFLCPFSYACPAAQKIAETEGLLGVPLTLDERQDLEELDTLAAEYDELGEEIRWKTDRRKEIRDTLVERVTGKVVSPNFSMNVYDVKGRESIDRDALELIASEYGFEIPMKVGNGYQSLRVTNLYGPTHKND